MGTLKLNFGENTQAGTNATFQIKKRILDEALTHFRLPKNSSSVIFISGYELAHK